jgi:hypothetical protein
MMRSLVQSMGYLTGPDDVGPRDPPGGAQVDSHGDSSSVHHGPDDRSLEPDLPVGTSVMVLIYPLMGGHMPGVGVASPGWTHAPHCHVTDLDGQLVTERGDITDLSDAMLDDSGDALLAAQGFQPVIAIDATTLAVTATTRRRRAPVCTQWSRAAARW